MSSSAPRSQQSPSADPTLPTGLMSCGPCATPAQAEHASAMSLIKTSDFVMTNVLANRVLIPLTAPVEGDTVLMA